MDGPTVEQVHILLRWLKEAPTGGIPIQRSGKVIGSLRAVTWEDAGDTTALERLARWHESAFSWFPESFPVTLSSVRHWLIEQILPQRDRVLFWICDTRDNPVGHIGAARLDLVTRTATIGDAVSAHSSAELLLQQARETLTDWLKDTIGVEVLARSTRRAA